MIRMKHAFKFLLFFAVIVMSCVDQIDFEVPAELSDSVVIQGRVVKGERDFVEVDVSRLFDFSAESRRRVPVKTVVLSDDQNNEMVLETRVPGSYFQVLDASTAVQAEVGRGYKLRVETLDDRIFESIIDVMPENKKPQKLELTIVKQSRVDNFGITREFDKVQIAIDTEVNRASEGGVYWELNNTYKVTDQGFVNGFVQVCYIEKTVNVNEIYVLDPSQLRTGFISDYILSFASIDGRFGEELYYNVKQYSLSRGAFKFWNGVNILSERGGGYFDGPTGEVRSNFFNINDPDDIVYGYFFATEEAVIGKKAVLPEGTNVIPICPQGQCFVQGSTSCSCGLCCDCLLDPDATTVKPSYWED